MISPQWSGRKVLFASSIGAWLPVLSIVVLGGWRTTGVPFFLGIAVASWLALVIDLVVVVVTMRKPQVQLDWPEVTTVNKTIRVPVLHGSPTGGLIEVLSSATGEKPLRARIGSGAPLVARFDQRAVHNTCFGSVEYVGPLGLIGCERRFSAPITMAVGPAHDVRSSVPDMPGADQAVEAVVTAPGADLTRSIRPYRRGDQQRSIAWKATARSGDLMVRELEGIVETELVLELQLRQPPKSTAKPRVSLAHSNRRHVISEVDDANEAAVARAYGYAAAAMAAGMRVRLRCRQTVPVPSSPRAPRRFGQMRVVHVVGESVAANVVVRSETHLAYLLAGATVGDLDPADSAEPTLFVTATGDSWVASS